MSIFVRASAGSDFDFQLRPSFFSQCYVTYIKLRLTPSSEQLTFRHGEIFSIDQLAFISFPFLANWTFSLNSELKHTMQ